MIIVNNEFGQVSKYEVFRALINARMKIRNIKPRKNQVTLSYIMQSVCEHFNIGGTDILKVTREREIVQYRQLAMYEAKMTTTKSLNVIGRMMGNKDHATVMHAKKTISNLIETDRKFRAKIEEFEKEYNLNYI